jgi:hypothetical protein
MKLMTRIPKKKLMKVAAPVKVVHSLSRPSREKAKKGVNANVRSISGTL